MACHPDRVRRFGALPEGYQFGDGRFGDMLDIALISRAYAALPWRPMHENAAERLRRYQQEYIAPCFSGPQCVCAALTAEPALIPPFEAVTCPAHPQRTFRRGPVGETN